MPGPRYVSLRVPLLSLEPELSISLLASRNHRPERCGSRSTGVAFALVLLVWLQLMLQLL